jgi:hypothetical protein
MGTIQKRACDGCHRRKVKCDSNSPCRNCGTANIQCTYNAIPQKKGPKGSRAKVISELRENQRMTSLPVKVQARINGVQVEPITHHNPTPGLLTHDIAKSCLNFFFEHVYTKLPILHRETIESQMPSLERNPDTYCLFTSLCAFMMLQPGMAFPMGDYNNMDMPYGANIAASTILIEECIRVRKGQDVKGFEHWEKPSLNVLATNFFIFAYYYAQENHSSAWYYLREGTTIIQMSGMGNEENYQQQDFDSIRRRRLFWLFHNAERAYALQRSYPVTLQATLHVGQNGDCPTDDPFNSSLNNNFFNLCGVYQNVDDAFLNAWRLGCRNLDAQTITSLNTSLREVLPQQYPPSNYSGVQNWLRKMLWEVTEAQESRLRVSQLLSHFPNPQYEMLVNSGLIPKLIQVTLDLIPYLTNAPPSRSPTTAGPEQYLQILWRICMAIGNDHFQFVPLLLSKVQEILPRIIDPKLLNAPIEAVDYNRMPADIFDGFGNAGMAHMPMNDYNTVMPMEQYDNKYEDMSGNSPDSLPHSHHSHHSNSPPNSQLGDMPQNFVSSPGTVMSPGTGMDYNPTIGAFNMTDMVISPMGGPAPPNAMHMQQQQQQQLNNPSQMQGIPNQNINAPSLNQGIGSLYGGVRQPSRQSSFNMPGQTPLSAMGSMPGGLDFNTLPR